MSRPIRACPCLATELTLAFQFLHVHRGTELRKVPHDEVLAALFPHPCTAESLQRVAHITAYPRRCGAVD